MAYLRHTYEGPDDMPAHIKAALMPVSLSIPVQAGRMVLGTWQGIYLVEHRTRPHTRKVALHLMALEHWLLEPQISIYPKLELCSIACG